MKDSSNVRLLRYLMFAIWKMVPSPISFVTMFMYSNVFYLIISANCSSAIIKILFEGSKRSKISQGQNYACAKIGSHNLVIKR